MPSPSGGIVLLGSSALFPLGVALLAIGLMLDAGATGAVKAIRVSAKLLAGRSPDTPGDRQHHSSRFRLRRGGWRVAGYGFPGRA
jgi:hypothetical protein